MAGALVELTGNATNQVIRGITSPTGAYTLIAPDTGRYQLRVAAIGYLPAGGIVLAVTPSGVRMPPVVLRPASVRLPDIEVIADHRFCGRDGVTDRTFLQLLESARLALQVIDATIRSKEVGFQVKLVNTRIYYGRVENVSAADTTEAPLVTWPVESVGIDSLRAFGFSRLKVARDEGTRVYYGPDARVLFAPWFLDQHCFSIGRLDHAGDTLRVKFVPRGKPKQVDIQGELVLDREALALHRLTFSHVGLPGWIPDRGSGGEMQFTRLSNGLWVTWSWAIWAPIAGMSAGSNTPELGGLAEARGWVERIVRGGAVADSGPPPR